MKPQHHIASWMMLILVLTIASHRLHAATIINAVLCKEYRDGKPQDVATTFAPTEHKLHCVVKFNKISKASVRFVWIAVNARDSDGGTFKNVKVYEKTLPSQELEQAHGSIEVTQDWPVGDYKVDLYIDGKKVKTLTYTIK